MRPLSPEHNQTAIATEEEVKAGFKYSPSFIANFGRYERAYYRQRDPSIDADKEKVDGRYQNDGSGDAIFKATKRVFEFAKNVKQCNLDTDYVLGEEHITDEAFHAKRVAYSKIVDPEGGKDTHYRYAPVPISDMSDNPLPFDRRNKIRKDTMALTCSIGVVLGKKTRMAIKIRNITLLSLDVKQSVDRREI
jgi:hypothetical protein